MPGVEDWMFTLPCYLPLPAAHIRIRSTRLWLLWTQCCATTIPCCF